MKTNKITFKITESDEIIQDKGYYYTVQKVVDDFYSGFGRFCKDLTEVGEYINKEIESINA